MRAWEEGENRVGVGSHTNEHVDFRHLGYGPYGVVLVLRLIALEYLGVTVDFLKDFGLTVVPKDGNHLNLRRDNIHIQYKTINDLQQEMTLPQLKERIRSGDFATATRPWGQG